MEFISMTLHSISWNFSLNQMQIKFFAVFNFTKFSVKSNGNQFAVIKFPNIFVKSNANEVVRFNLTKSSVKSDANLQKKLHYRPYVHTCFRNSLLPTLEFNTKS